MYSASYVVQLRHVRGVGSRGAPGAGAPHFLDNFFFLSIGDTHNYTVSTLILEIMLTLI